MDLPVINLHGDKDSVWLKLYLDARLRACARRGRGDVRRVAEVNGVIEMESGRSKTKGKQADVRKRPNEIYLKQNLSEQKRGPGSRTMSTTWGDGVFEVAHTSGVGRHVRAIGDNVDKRNGAQRLGQSRRGEESPVRRRTRVG